MKKEFSLYHLIVLTIFIGVLLTGMVFYITDVVFDQQSTKAEQCYDGTAIEGDSFLDRFHRSVYQNASSLELIKNYQYRLFGIVNHTNVLAGKNNFLFEIHDEKNNYNYLQDYLGHLSFTEQEHEQILDTLAQRKAAYAERGAEYLLVILPNSQTVYNENMPAYLGDKGVTRLDQLESYLREQDFYSFINLSDALREYKSEGALYNNTENSLNALGLYYTYLAVCERFRPTVMSKTRIISPDELSFYQHWTTGKSVARQCGLADVAQNLTVSLSNGTRLKYHVQYSDGRVSRTVLKPPFDSSNVSETPALLLQFSGTWERLQLEPFFSNTFLHVTYQTDLADDAEIFEKASPRVVMQFIYENELSQLLP